MAVPALARESQPLDTGRTVISLISTHDSVAPGQSEPFYIALKMQLEGNWYTYWRNPGDSGEPVNIVWDLPEGVTAGPIIWPAPHIKMTGPIASYALDGEVILPVRFNISPDIPSGTNLRIRAKAFYLVCDDVCVPEDGALSLMLSVGEPEPDTARGAVIKAAITDAPKIDPAVLGAVKLLDDYVSFDLTKLPNRVLADATDLQLFPHDTPLINHSAKMSLTRGERGLRFSAPKGYGWEGDLPVMTDATLTYELDGQSQSFIAGHRLGESLGIGPVISQSAARIPTSTLTLWGAAIGAFLGGLVLNLMPCVFPIISLKALSLAKTAHGERRTVRRAAWGYTAGVLVSFLLLAGILLIIKATGEQVGWGFQLQSPWLVGLLAVLLFVIGLNLLGLFEFGTGLQNLGQDTVSKGGPGASFLTGCLAVIVATPCTAPFMAGAVGYALAQPAVVTLIVFLALGLGFALPFLLVGYFPQLLARLPRPGPWMLRFREFLAFPMLAAAIYLVWVLSVQAGANGVARVLLAMLAAGFAVWAFARRGVFAKIIGGLAVLLTLYLPFSVSAAGTDTTAHTPWSPAQVAALRAQGRPVFVDFTAAWCVTCKVNEALVLDTDKTRALFARTNTAFLVADWTNKNDEIAQELARFGRAGVPLYLVYRPGEEAEILPQVLTQDALESALKP